jgi:hypothetical protein
MPTGAEDDDDDVDVVGVDGDDEGVIYYYYCDYYSLLHSPKIEGRGREGVQSSFRANLDEVEEGRGNRASHAPMRWKMENRT